MVLKMISYNNKEIRECEKERVDTSDFDLLKV